jgi:hypothetical protein
MKPYVMQYLNLSTFPDIERFLHELGARILIVAYDDLEKDKDGFIGVLLRSVFASAMVLETREQWEPYLGLTHKVVKGTPEHLNPFVFIHRLVLAYSEKWGLEILKKGHANDRTMKVIEPALDSYRRFTEIQLSLQAEADHDLRLLTAFDVTAPPPPPPPKEFPHRIPHNCTIYQPAIHQPVISAAPQQTQRKRLRSAKTTVPEEGATSKTKKPKVTPKLPTQTRTTTGPESNTHGSASAKNRKAAAAPKSSNPDLSTQAHTSPDTSTPLEAIAAPESDTHGGVSGRKRKAAATASSYNPDPSTHNKKKQSRTAAATTGSDSKTQGSATGKKRNAVAAPTPSDPDPPTHNKKQGCKAAATTSSDGLTHPESQADVVSTQPKDVTHPQKDEGDVGIPIEDVDEVPQPNPAPAPPPPIQDTRFSTVNGRIVPSGRRNLLINSDRFTEKEQLALYTKYMQVTMRQRLQSTLRTAAMWFDMWQEVAMVIPGRGVMNCIEFYAENEKNFSF